MFDFYTYNYIRALKFFFHPPRRHFSDFLAHFAEASPHIRGEKRLEEVPFCGNFFFTD